MLRATIDTTLRCLGLALVLLVIGTPSRAETQDAQYVAAVGGVTYRSYCANCHGKEGKGDGPVSQYLKVDPTDLTLLAKNNKGEFPAERVHKSIDGREALRTHGSREMPIWGDALQRPGPNPEEKVEKKIEALVGYIESLQKK